jgi:nickel-dependent lactate racemase
MAVDNRIENIITRRPSFLLNVVLNEEHQILKVFAGNYILAHREACSFADEVYEASVSESSG